MSGEKTGNSDDLGAHLKGYEARMLTTGAASLYANYSFSWPPTPPAMLLTVLANSGTIRTGPVRSGDMRDEGCSYGRA
jgi:hypothetical protein